MTAHSRCFNDVAEKINLLRSDLFVLLRPVGCGGEPFALRFNVLGWR